MPDQNQPYVTPDSFWNFNQAPQTPQTPFATNDWGFNDASNWNQGTGPNSAGGMWDFLGNFGKGIGGASSFSEATGGPNLMQSIFGGKDLDTKSYTPGFAGGAASLGSDIFGGYMQFKNMKMAEDALKFQKKSSNRNYQAQKHAFNEEAASINAAREARAPGAGHRIQEL